MVFASTWLMLLVSSALAAPVGWLDGAPLHAASPEVVANVSALQADSDWRVAARAEAAVAWQADPALAQALVELRPRTTRAGSLTFAGPGIDLPGADAVLLDRLLYGDEDAQVRAALTRAVAARISHPEALVLLMSDPSPVVRASVVSPLVRTASHADVVHLGLTDHDAAVREAALFTVERRPDIERYTADLLDLSVDPSVPVRVRALRTAVRIDAPGAWELGVASLSHPEAQVRSTALAALHGANSERASTVGAARALLTDADPAVRRTAERLLQTPPR